jgi:type I restriction enzyme R subunit
MYDDTGIDQLQGAFYATTSKNKVKFNNFREELESDYIDELNKNPIKDEIENEILRDTNYEVIKFSPEFISNKNEKTPTNSILSSLFSKNRLKMMLQY